MRPKGWKNDPAWVAYYAAKEEAWTRRQVERVKVEADIERLMRESDAAMRRMREERFFK